MFSAKRHPVNKWVERVLSGKICTGKLQRLAVERHVRDLERSKDTGFWFDQQAAQTWIDFFSLLRHWKGPWAGKPILLEPWQQFVIASVFGWKQANGLRRFREALEEIARKNGKTTKVAGIGVGGMVLEQEPGALIVSAATKKDQAKLAWEDAKRLVRRSPELVAELEFYATAIVYPEQDSKFVPLGADDDTLDGLDIYMAIIDELHAHKTRGVYDVLDSATSNREQPLIFSITTAGFNQASFCKLSMRDYGEKVLHGVLENERFFFFICELDEDDDHEDESVWIKANPNLGVSVHLDDLRAKALKAKHDPAALANFLCKHLNKWVNSGLRYLKISEWDACRAPVNEKELVGRVCFSGLDMADTDDLAALVHVFPREDGSFVILPRFFVPEDRIAIRSEQDRAPYEQWRQQGVVIATEGDAVDYGAVEHQINKDRQQFDIRELAFDRWGIVDMMQRLKNTGLTVVEFPQSYGSMSPATKSLSILTKTRRLVHGANPVMRWMASNLICTRNAQGDVRPSKEKSAEKIDGIVALIMALDRAIRGDAEPSVYEERGIEVW